MLMKERLGGKERNNLAKGKTFGLKKGGLGNLAGEKRCWIS